MDSPTILKALVRRTDQLSNTTVLNEYYKVRSAKPADQRPKPKARRPKTEARSPKPEAQRLKPEVQSPKTKPKDQVNRDFSLWALGFGLRASVFGLWFLGFGLQSSGFGLRASVFRLWDLGFGLWTFIESKLKPYLLGSTP